MNDLKFTTAGDFMKPLTENGYIYDYRDGDPSLVYKGYTYEYANGEHQLWSNTSGSVYYLKHAFDIAYIPKASEIMHVIDTWIRRGL